jgi:hypothetical protein
MCVRWLLGSRTLPADVAEAKGKCAMLDCMTYGTAAFLLWCLLLETKEPELPEDVAEAQEKVRGRFAACYNA